MQVKTIESTILFKFLHLESFYNITIWKSLDNDFI